MQRSWPLMLLAWSAVPLAGAHHSGAMFDQSRQVTLTGSVREFQWTGPHCFIQLLVPAAGKQRAVEWSIEMGPPNSLYRAGWRANTLQAGEQITVVLNPMRDGTAGGNFLAARRADGTPIGKDRALK